MPGSRLVSKQTVLDKRRLESLGVLLPVRLRSLSFLPGRHPLGRAGDGMRLLRVRPFESGQDNPRDIDKFSPAGQYWINEWEAEAQATIDIYADVSGSMSTDATAAVRNLALLQLTYSLWRAGDRVRTVLYSGGAFDEIAERNLKAQLEQLTDRLGSSRARRGGDALAALSWAAGSRRCKRADLAFILSDFREEAKVNPERERWRSALRSLSCDVVPVIVSFQLSESSFGSIKLGDPETDRHRLVLLTPARARLINGEEAARASELERMFKSIGLDPLVLRNEQDVYPALAALSRLRRRRRI